MVGAASGLGGAATSAGLLYAARGLQGAFAALLAPAALSLISTTFTEPHERAKAFGVYGAISGGGAAIGRMLLDKQFHGDLEASSKGTMLAAGTGAKNSSGGYVALEIVTGTLKGRTGTFVLQHSATMNRGVPQLSINVVPDSGTGQLSGLAGKMNITIVDGKHTYATNRSAALIQRKAPRVRGKAERRTLRARIRRATRKSQIEIGTR